jgi:hypothetical protein
MVIYCVSPFIPIILLHRGGNSTYSFSGATGVSWWRHDISNADISILDLVSLLRDDLERLCENQARRRKEMTDVQENFRATGIGNGGVGFQGDRLAGFDKGVDAAGISIGVAGASIEDLSPGRGIGVRGLSGSGSGVEGTSTSGAGVEGISTSGAGIGGRSQGGVGVDGMGGRVGVNGASDSTGVHGSGETGVHGESVYGRAVHGSSNHGHGGWFDGGADGSPLHLEPGGATTPTTGQRGDLFVDDQGNLWFCKMSGPLANEDSSAPAVQDPASAKWVKII